jgi:hypothetical protein
MKYSREELDRWRPVALKALGLVAATSGVYYAYQNEKVRAHVWHLRNKLGSFSLSFFGEDDGEIVQMSGEAPVDENGRILEVTLDEEGTASEADMTRLAELIEKPADNPLQTD